MINYDTLLQNATDIITKCDSYFITNCDRSLLQKASSFLLQNETILLQNATFITNCASTPLYKPESSFANTFQDFPKTVTFMFLKFWSSYFQG